MPRAIWKGSISFGLVEIPVALSTAERSEREIAFHFLDRRTMKPVGFQRVNKETGEEVPWGEIVRAYEHEKGEYVVLTDAELKKANVETSQSVDIVAFVEMSEIDAFFFSKPYYLTPLKKQSKGYALLHETLRRTGKAGIAKVVLRTRQHLAALVVRGPALALVLLRYADELLDPVDAGIEASHDKEKQASDAELKLAAQLVEGMTQKWEPEKFHDDYREDVLELIARKLKTGHVETAGTNGEKPRSGRGGSIVDLMPLLKKSVAAARGGRSDAAPRRRRAKGA